jgi:cell division protein FtsQ
MARRSAAATAEGIALPASKRAATPLRSFKQVMTAILIVASLIVVVWLYFSVERFLVSDARFFLPGPPEPGQRSAYFQVEGVTNVLDEQVVQVFAGDFGRSIYLCPLEKRRLRLLGIDWVKDASISRLWPNRLVIRIRERTPAAAVQLPAADGSLLLSLVDADGVLLDPQRVRPFRLPVLTGITRKESDASRKERMKRFLRLQSELGSYMDKISEIDVSDVDNLKAIQQFDERAITLMLGNQSYRERYENLLNNQEDIRKRLPDAIILDLRLKDRITAVSSAPRPVQGAFR